MGEIQTAVHSAQIFDVSPDGGWQSGSSYLFKNIESYPGQLLTVPSIISAKQEQKITRRDAVKGARHIERTNEHIRGGIDRKVNMVIGARLRMQSTPQAELLGMIAGWTPEFTKAWRKEWSRKCEVIFHDWAYSKRCVQDGERHYNFGGLMWMSYRSVTGPDASTAGFIGYDEERARRYNSRWATFLQMIDTDRIQTPHELAGADERTLFEGRKLDEWGAMTGFYAQKGHPSDIGLDSIEYEFIPRETEWGRPFGFHWFMKTRPGAQHGITSLITSLRPATMLDRFDDARLGSVILQELFAFYVKSAADPETVARSLAPAADGLSPFDRRLDFYKKAKIRVGQHRAALLPPGDELEMLTSNRAASDTSGFVNQFLRKIAMALDLPFEQFANDYSQANYSSIRASLLDAWRGVIAQRAMFGQHVPALVFDAVIEEAIFKGYLQLPPGAPSFRLFRDAYTACSVTGPGMGWVDPKREAEAAEIRLRSRVTSRQREAAANGDDHLEIFDELADENQEAKDRGISLDVAPPAGANASASDDDDDVDTPEDRRSSKNQED